ncbi:adenosylcobalamin-dependent ribonucleoside-diphosphate reductase [Anaerolineae bacterium CFX9]|nr:adenosylcobalamin-dependent ribonucleoside-diphosphate reductase [Anaerolineae bacterium CFX9]
MVQIPEVQRSTPKNTLHDLGYKIFLDRYAQKDMNRTTLTVGDTVIVVVDSKTGQREIGKITAMALPEITIQLLDGETVTRDIEHVDKPLETEPGQMMDRVARGIAAVEATPELQQVWAERFRWLLDDFKFVPAGRILAAAGTDQLLTFYNCYVIPSPRDSRTGIIETLRQMTEIMSRGGGVGINISSLRPRHGYVKGVNGRSSGSVSWGALYSFVTGLIEQGGSRRGALMLILNDWHPDVFEFINSKREAGKITNANISVGVSDKLMEAVKVDGDWDLVFPDSNFPQYDEEWDGDLDKWLRNGYPVVKHRTVKAREVWNAIVESAWTSAEPGVWFSERSNKMSNSWYFNPLVSTNPCGEQPLAGWSVCNLGALNLARFYDEEKHDVAWDTLDTCVRYATRFLDNVIDSTPYFFEENEKQQLNERRVGLNNMGLAELMIRLGIRYGSDESLAFIDRLYSFIARAAYETSADLAAEKGAFPMFDAEKFLQSGFMQSMPEDIRARVRERGIRNVTLLTQAPTGTTGTMVNTSTGIEPFFSWVYYRKSRLGLHEEQVPLVKAWFEAHPDETKLPDYFVTAMDLAPEEHAKVQAAIQRWVDAAISKTSNLPNHYTVEQTRAFYEYLYELGCKGGTVYRDGSRDEQVLMLKGDKRAEEEIENRKKKEEAPAAQVPVEQVATPHRVYPRPKRLTGVTTSTRTPFGTAYITMNSDENGYPFEVFITAPGKAGSDLQADAEGLGRMISLQLRTTAPQNRLQMLRLVIDQLKDIGGARSVGMGPNRVLSLPDAVAGALLDQYFSEEKAQQLNLFTPAEVMPVDTPPAAESAPSANDHAQNGTAALNGNGHAPRNGHAEPGADGSPVTGYMTGADMCPSCATISLIRVDGCRKCLTCGYSEC